MCDTTMLHGACSHSFWGKAEQLYHSGASITIQKGPETDASIHAVCQEITLLLLNNLTPRQLSTP